MRKFSLLVVMVFWVAACADEPYEGGGGEELKEETTQAPDLGTRGDSLLEIVESGRLISPGQATMSHDGTTLDAFRVHGFGDTRVRVELDATTGEVDPFLLIEGPLPERTGRVVAHNDDRDEDSLDSLIEVVLEEPGAYRILAGSVESFFGMTGSAGELQLSFECLENCHLPHLTLSELVEILLDDLPRDDVQDLLEEKIGEFFDNPAIAADVSAQLADALEGAEVPDLDGFPAIPLSVANLVRGLFDSQTAAVAEPEPVTFVLDELLEEHCEPNRPSLEEVSAYLPGLQRGGIADYTHEDCSLRRTEQFVEVLNNLALDNGSAVVHGEDRFESVESVIRALLASGHQITAENNRYIANFLSLYHEGRTVAAPVWLDTGISLPDGGNLRIPAPHSHYTFRVDGPLFRGVLAFFMGIPGGTAFRPDASLLRPNSWSGERTTVEVHSDDDPERIVDLFVTAADLRAKWHEAGRTMPNEGYGLLGVCNDSTALLELKTEGTVTLFPLVHESTEDPQDGIDDLFQQLPNDLEGFDDEEALDRIVQSMPFDGSQGLDLDRMPFPGLKAALQSLGR